jgi:hypothetical protein
MTYQKKNLLEAFQASAAASKARASEGASKDVPRAAGPFARSSPAARVEDPELPLLDAPPRPRWQLDGTHRLIVLQVVIATAAFFLGRASVSTVDAKSGADAGKQSQVAGVNAPQSEPEKKKSTESAKAPASASSTGAQVSVAPGTAAERALLDPANLYTVKVAEYVKGRDDEVALATLAWLEGQGLPAVAKFKGTRLFLVLGAAAKQKELDQLLQTAKTMNGPPPRNKAGEFHDAYVVNIESLGIR